MPKIPLASPAGIAHAAGAAPLAMRGQLHRVNNGDAKSILNAGNAVLDAGNRIVNAMLDWKEKKIDTENRLAAAEDRAELKNSAEELRNWIAANPGASDEDKEAKIAEWEKNYQTKHREFSGRMTENFRKQHEVEIAAIRQSVANDRRYTVMQSAVQRQLDIFNRQFNDACSRGDFGEAQWLIAQHEGTLLNGERAKYLQEDFLPQREEAFAVKNLAESDPDNVLGQLKARNNEGSFANYTKLTEQYRDQMIRFCEVKIFERDKAKRTEVLQNMLDGKIPAPQEIKAMEENGEISAEMAVRLQQDMETFAARKEAEAQREQAKRLEQYQYDLERGADVMDPDAIDQAVKAGTLSVGEANRMKGIYNTVMRRKDQDKRIAESDAERTSRKQSDADYRSFMVSLEKGTPLYTREQLNEMHGKGKLNDEDFLRYDAALDKYQSGKLSWERYERQLIEEKNRQAEAKKKADYGKLQETFKYIVFKTDFSPDPALAAKQQKELIDLAGKWFPGDPDTLLKMEEEIGRRHNESGKKDAVFNTPSGKIIDEHISQLFNDPIKYAVKDDFSLSKIVAAAKIADGDGVPIWKCYEYAEEMLKQGKSVTEIKAGIDDIVYKGNTKAIDDILSGRTGGNNPFTGAQGTTYILNGQSFYISKNNQLMPDPMTEDDMLIDIESYEVKDTTTFEDLAVKLGTDANTLRRLNRSEYDSRSLAKGTVLVVPVRKKTESK